MKNNFKSLNKVQEMRGDPTEWLYRQYAGRVYSLSLRMLGDIQAAEEATAAVFIRLARALEGRPIPPEVEDLLLRTTVSVLLRHLGDQRSEASPQAGVSGQRRAALRSLGQRSLAPALLEEAIRRLPVDSRFAFVLHDVEGLSHEKIVALLGWTPGSAKAALAKARLELRELLLDPSHLAAVGELARPSKIG
jgi:RNA polymerase sigma-70 factor (ECF subfamily)